MGGEVLGVVAQVEGGGGGGGGLQQGRGGGVLWLQLLLHTRGLVQSGPYRVALKHRASHTVHGY